MSDTYHLKQYLFKFGKLSRDMQYSFTSLSQLLSLRLQNLQIITNNAVP